MAGRAGKRRNGTISRLDAPTPRGAAIAAVVLAVAVLVPSTSALAAPAAELRCPGAGPGHPDFEPQGAVPVVDSDGNERGTLLTCTYSDLGASLEVLIPTDRSHCPTNPARAITVSGPHRLEHPRAELIAEIDRICAASAPSLGVVAAVVGACGLLFGGGLLVARRRRPPAPQPAPPTPAPDPRQLAARRRSLRREKTELQTQLSTTAAAAQRQAEITRLTTAGAPDVWADPREAAERALLDLLATQRRVGSAIQRLTNRERPLVAVQPLCPTNTDLVSELRAATDQAHDLASTIDAARRRSRSHTARITWIKGQELELPTPEDVR